MVVSRSKASASTPLRVYAKRSPTVSVAATGMPMLVPAGVFSKTTRIVLSPSKNPGAVFVVGGSGVGGGSTVTTSFMSVTLIVTVIVSVRLSSETVIVTV